MMNLELRNKEDLTLLESSMVNGYVNILRNENGDKFVDLEDLYNYLEIKTKRKDWLSRNIENNELFEEGFDYIKLTLKKEHESGVKYEKQIIATMDCAKQLSMMAKNDKGKNIRKYFIECEKQLHIDNTKDKLLLSLFSNNPLEVATAHKSLLEIETKPLIATIEKQKPDVEFSQRVQDSVNQNYSMQEASKLLKLPFGRYMSLGDDTYKRKAIGNINQFLKVREQIQDRKSKLKKSLVTAKGGRGTDRKIQALTKLRENESNYCKTFNHSVSKMIVQFAKKYKCQYIHMEKLEKDGFPNMILRNWSFYQLREMVKYKAEREGIELRLVDPAYTSQECSCCGNIDSNNRPKKDKGQAYFKCTKSGFELNADHNAAINIARSSKFMK